MTAAFGAFVDEQRHSTGEAPGMPHAPVSLHIMHVVLSLDVGGLERVVLDLARAARRRGHNISVLCIDHPGTLAGEAEALGIAVHCINKGPGLKISVRRTIAGILASRRPDIIHTHQITALFYTGPVARRAAIPTVHTEHGKMYASRWRTRLLGRLASRSAQRFFCVSQDIATEVRHWRIARPEKISVVPNGLDLHEFADEEGRVAVRELLGVPAGAVVIGTVGRLSEIKRQDLLIRAVAAVNKAGRAAHVLIVGDGPLRRHLADVAKQMGMADKVHFAGYQARPQPFYYAMDIFALTSRSEGMPLAVLEAWAARRPVVASRVGGLPEIISDGNNGILFDSGNESALKEHLLALIDNRSRAIEIARAGRKTVAEKYNLDQTMAAYETHYLKLARR